MSKGSKRRPAQIDAATEDANWQRTFEKCEHELEPKVGLSRCRRCRRWFSVEGGVGGWSVIGPLPGLL